VVKQNLGLAGQGALRLWEPELLAAQRRWIAHSLKQGRKLVIEPWHPRQFDFSVQLEMEQRGLRLIGFSTLLVDQKGQYQGNRAAPNFRQSPPVEVTRLLAEQSDITRRINQLYSAIISKLEPELRLAGYSGPVGIDAFVYRDSEGRSRLKPIVEINPRYTMGRLTLELMKQLYPGSHGTFRLLNLPQIRREGFETFLGYVASLAQRGPLQLAGEPVPKLRGGALCLNDPAVARVCLAVLQVSPDRATV